MTTATAPTAAPVPVTIHRRRSDGWDENFAAEAATLPGLGPALRRVSQCETCKAPLVSLEEFRAEQAKRGGPDWPPPAMRPDPQPAWTFGGRCDRCRFEKALVRLGREISFAENNLRDVIARFESDYPGLFRESLDAHKISIADPFAGSLFNPGRVHVTDQPAASPVDWKSLVLQHINGDWGLIGKAAEVGEPGPLELWSAVAQPRLTRNVLALRSGAGVVVSSFPCPPEAEAKLQPGNARSFDPWHEFKVAIATLIGPRPATAGWFHRASTDPL